ncbi:4'-phosphopantetheinyl transferase superfamily protein [Geodermatophilus sabuli]|uniref:4'-phosphopantetheinyl transferase superfamily protein n=1 Tax=Geodermatophilus sabuli TaxID=1564158 RepID=A0A7K3W383_9ACTN|nr:4'-phosphopantetheinyl transferase superfamily protein [Geodermatophilus sabuli]NEK58377.1 4'-phosphopantetheinyl transferase superfamily protein [Geodermatophilus sabuli]
MIEQILPPAAASAEAWGDLPSATPAAGEEALPGRVTPARRAEFATGRELARRALAGLGLPPAPVPRDRSGAPVWPSGVVGSLTHCPGYRAAVVARRRELGTVGVDAEPALPLPDGVLPVVARPDERTALRRLAVECAGTCWDRLLFCCKEAVYKAWYPLTGGWLDYADVRVVLGRHGTFSATLPAGQGPLGNGLRGRWLARDGLLVVAVAGRAAAGPAPAVSGCGAAGP